MSELHKNCNLNRTGWMLDFGHEAIVVHEYRADGTSITHIRRAGYKTTLVNEILGHLLASRSDSKK